MDYNYQPHDNSSRAKGVAIVVGVHVLVGWALVSGLARKAVEVIKKPLEATVIQEVKLPPPPPPPPKLIKPPEIKAPPRIEAPPPPPFIPPPEIVPPPSPAAPAITAIPTPPPAPPVIAPPPPPAPPAPAPAPAGPVAIGVVCPTQVKPEVPRKALQEGISGVVKAQAVIRNGEVKEVTILSGPRIFHAAVRAAMMQYKCQSSATEVVATQEFDFKIQ
ncbi:MAG TPA: energy transducer TonB [Ideonella sp.]|nr:energy transducer TonB [Ideonella sp.]